MTGLFLSLNFKIKKIVQRQKFIGQPFMCTHKLKYKHGFIRLFEGYKANKYDNNFQIDYRAFSKKENFVK